MPVLTALASGYIALVFLLYLIIFASAFPKRELFMAIGIEVSLFIGVAAWRLFRAKSQSGKAKSVVLSELTSGGKSKLAKKVYERSTFTLWMIAAVIISYDFASFTSAFCGNFSIGETRIFNPGCRHGFPSEYSAGQRS
jgi:hypothetical protein